MKTINLQGTARKDLKKSTVKAIRRNNQVPCVIYGNNVENSHFTVVESDLKPLVYTPNSYIVNIDVDGTIHTGVLREIQFHPVTDKVMHIDFYSVNPDKPIIIDIPLTISGNSEGVRAGGKLQIVNRKLKVSALLKDLPDTLPIDISNLALGKSVVAGNLVFDNLNIITPKSTIICSVKMTRAAIGAAAAATAAEEKK